MNISIKRLKEIIPFLNHYLKLSQIILNRECVLGKYNVLIQFSKICFKYILIVLILGGKIDSVVIFKNRIYVLSPFSLIYSFEELFIYDTYFLELSSNNPTIIDCGSNIGMSVIYFYLIYPKCKITAIEADPTTYSVLVKNIETNNMLNRVNCINTAISNRKKKQITFYINDNEAGSLQMSTLPDRVDNKRKILVSASTLTSVIRKIKNKVDLLKIDIEGLEMKVLNELQTQNFRNIDHFIIEYHHHINPAEATFSKLLNILETNNFNYQLSTNKLHFPFKKGTYEDILVWAYKDKSIMTEQ